jgi:hypothetical protein
MWPCNKDNNLILSQLPEKNGITHRASNNSSSAAWPCAAKRLPSASPDHNGQGDPYLNAAKYLKTTSV